MDSARIAFALFLLAPAALHAHLPRIVSWDSIHVTQPEISQAFYGQLSGAAQVYHLDEKSFFDFFMQLLTPDLPGRELTL